METIQVAEATNEGAHGGAELNKKVEISKKDGRIRMCIVHGILLDDARQSNPSILPRMHKLSSPELEVSLIIERINKRLIDLDEEYLAHVTEQELGGMAHYLGTDVATELKHDTTLADPWACILEGKHPEMGKGRFWLFSIKVSKEVRA